MQTPAVTIVPTVNGNFDLFVPDRGAAYVSADFDRFTATAAVHYIRCRADELPAMIAAALAEQPAAVV